MKHEWMSFIHRQSQFALFSCTIPLYTNWPFWTKTVGISQEKNVNYVSQKQFNVSKARFCLAAINYVKKTSDINHSTPVTYSQ